MKRKSLRLTNSFNHVFVPNSSDLFSPRNIKIDIWDLDVRKVSKKFHPGIFRIDSISFNKSGGLFFTSSKPDDALGQISVFDTASLSIISNIKVNESCTNAIFNEGDKHIYFGTWDGNLYRWDTVSDELELILNIENSMIISIHASFCGDRFFLTVTPKSDETGFSSPDYINFFCLRTKSSKVLMNNKLSHSDRIQGVASSDNLLAYLTCRWVEGEPNYACTQLHIIDINSCEEIYSVSDIKKRDITNAENNLAFNILGELAVISFDAILFFDVTSGVVSRKINHKQATSVVFSEDGKYIAVGGDHATLYEVASATVEYS